LVDQTYRVIFTQLARNSLLEIVEYIKSEQKSPKNAEIVRKAILTRAKSLKKQPKRFSEYHLLHTDEANHRSVAVWNFIIVYEVDQKNLLVIIDDIFHGAEDK